MTDDPRTEDLRADQIQRARDERDQAREAPVEDERAAHDRRADKADYLADKLAERARSEEDG